MKKILSMLLLALLLVPASESFAQDSAYSKEINNWISARKKQLKSIESPLSYVGLLWLHEGKNTFGSGKDNELRLPAQIAREHAGDYTLKGDSIFLNLSDKSIGIAGKTAIHVKDLPLEDTYKYKASAKSIVLKKGTYQWFIINNKGRLGVRVFDSKSEEQRRGIEVERYAVDSSYHVAATFSPYPDKTFKTGLNVSGKEINNEVLGELTFTLKSKKIVFEAFASNGEYFIVFSDKTGESTSYPFRFLYVPKADASGKIWVDFNRSTNPNCAYSKYSFCPMPPKQNRLDIAVPAGEKKYEMIVSK